MFFAIITLLTALSIAGIAAWFSIVGLISIFSARAMAIAIMAGALEVGKLVSASWLYRNWHTASWFIKSYLIVAVLVLMLITSMGIFGFLSKAHLENTAVSSEVTLSIDRIDAKIAREKQKIQDAETVIGQLDETVQVLMNNERIRGPDGALAVRRGQAQERNELNSEIETSAATLAGLQDQRLELSQKNLAVEQELGPLKYVAELLYEDQSQENLDRAVRMFILLLVFVFDPLAVILLIAANNSLMQHGVALEKPATTAITTETPEPVVIPVASDTTEEIVEEIVQDTPTVSEPDHTVQVDVATTEPVQVETHDPLVDPVSDPAIITDPDPAIIDLSEKTQDEPEEQVNIVEVTETLKSDITDTSDDQVEPEVREMVEELVQNETTDLSQLQEVAKHLAGSKANKSNMTAEEIVEVLASSTKESEARKKLGFWAVRLPDKDL